MLTPTEFLARWNDNDSPPRRFPTANVERLRIATEDKQFLTEAGLPEDAAPFLSFQAAQSGELPTVAERWQQGEEFRRYRTIGSDGMGNPLALDEQSQGEVVCLDHERQFARVLLNRSVRQLAESLLAYRKLVRDTQAEFGVDAFLDGKAAPAARAALRKALATIDSAAMQAGCFWFAELQNLDANAASSS